MDCLHQYFCCCFFRSAGCDSWIAKGGNWLPAFRAACPIRRTSRATRRSRSRHKRQVSPSATAPQQMPMPQASSRPASACVRPPFRLVLRSARHWLGQDNLCPGDRRLLLIGKIRHGNRKARTNSMAAAPRPGPASSRQRWPAARILVRSC